MPADSVSVKQKRMGEETRPFLFVQCASKCILEPLQPTFYNEYSCKIFFSTVHGIPAGNALLDPEVKEFAALPFLTGNPKTFATDYTNSHGLFLKIGENQ